MPRSIAVLPLSRHRRRQSPTVITPMASPLRRGRADAEAPIRNRTALTNRQTDKRTTAHPEEAQTPTATSKTSETARPLAAAEWVVPGAQDKHPREPVETHPRIASTQHSRTFERLSKAGVCPKKPLRRRQPRVRTGNDARYASQPEADI